MNWDLTGQHVRAQCSRGNTVTGTVISSQVKHSGHVQHTVEVSKGQSVLVDHKLIETVLTKKSFAKPLTTSSKSCKV